MLCNGLDSSLILLSYFTMLCKTLLSYFTMLCNLFQMWQTPMTTLWSKNKWSVVKFNSVWCQFKSVFHLGNLLISPCCAMARFKFNPVLVTRFINVFHSDCWQFINFTIFCNCLWISPCCAMRFEALLLCCYQKLHHILIEEYFLTNDDWLTYFMTKQNPEMLSHLKTSGL